MKKNITRYSSVAIALMFTFGVSTASGALFDASKGSFTNGKSKSSTTNSDNSSSKTSNSKSSSNKSSGSSLIPPNAKAGECYAKVLIPATYKTEESKEILNASVNKIEVTKPEFKTVEKKMIDKAASFKYEFKPATYKCMKNTILIEPEKTTLKVIPATYKEIEKKVLISKAREYWKKGNGPITKIDHHTGDIMCLIKVPAKYKIVKSKVIDKPTRTEKVVVPAVTKSIKVKTIKTEASYEKIAIPATYKTITIQELVKKAEVIKTKTEPTYHTISKTTLETPEELKWERILCQTNTSGDIMKSIQNQLISKNYDPGLVDGIYGVETQAALTKFQKDNKLATGALTIESLDALGVK